MTREEYGLAYERGFDFTVRFLLSRGARPGDGVADAAQAAWTKGWEKLSQLRDPRLLVTWINTIALNAYRASFRRESRFRLLADVKTRSGIDLAAIDIDGILKNCRPADRALLEQRMRGVTTAEIAREWGVTETAIRIRFLRARRAVRRRVEITAASPVQLRPI